MGISDSIINIVGYANDCVCIAYFMYVINFAKTGNTDFIYLNGNVICIYIAYIIYVFKIKVYIPVVIFGGNQASGWD